MRSPVTISTQSGPAANPNVHGWRCKHNTKTLLKRPCRLTQCMWVEVCTFTQSGPAASPQYICRWKCINDTNTYTKRPCNLTSIYICKWWCNNNTKIIQKAALPPHTNICGWRCNPNHNLYTIWHNSFPHKSRLGIITRRYTIHSLEHILNLYYNIMRAFETHIFVTKLIRNTQLVINVLELTRILGF